MPNRDPAALHQVKPPMAAAVLGSPELSFTLDEGQVAAFKCRLRGGPFDAIACLFTHDRWIILQPSMTGDVSDTM
jgi:hypothetical protein